MKERRKNFFIVLFFISIILIAFLVYTYQRSLTKVKCDYETLNEYELDSRERFIASQSIMNDTNYSTADYNEKLQLTDLESNHMNLRYKTINKYAGTITSSNYSQDVYLDIEIRYKWNTDTNTFAGIDEIGGGLLHFENLEIGSLLINGGDFNFEKTVNSYRISETAVLEYQEFDSCPNENQDILSAIKGRTGFIITTNPKTYAILIQDSDFY
ncbi:MAG: hypothetical protein ACERKZ_16590 [Lachnotalea sp.]